MIYNALISDELWVRYLPEKCVKSMPQYVAALFNAAAEGKYVVGLWMIQHDMAKTWV